MTQHSHHANHHHHKPEPTLLRLLKMFLHKWLLKSSPFFLLIVGLIIGYTQYKSFEQRKDDYKKLMGNLKMQSDQFSGEVGIYIKDIWSGESVKINSDKLFPSASLVKVPIMAAVFEADKEGILSLDAQLVLKRRHKIKSGKGLYHYRSGKKFKVRELVEHMIDSSDNTATNMLVEALGFNYLNRKFAEFGLKSTDIQRGVMELRLRNMGIENYTTPEDMAVVLEKIYKKELVSEIASREMLEILKRQKINDRIPYLLPDNLAIAHKTGTLRDTLSDCGIVFTPKGDFIICVITLDITNYRLAKRFIREIACETYEFCYSEKS